MRVLVPVIFGLFIILLFGTVELVLLRSLNRPWWGRRHIRWAATALPVLGVVLIVAWGAGEYYNLPGLLYPGAIGSAGAFVVEVALMLSLPLSGMIHLIQGRFDRTRSSRQSPTPVDQRRRLFLKGSATALPMATLAMGATGLAGGFSSVRVDLKPIRCRNLPHELHGLRLLHLSDLHLHHYVTAEDLEEVLVTAKAYFPDVVIITGDVADDLDQLPAALKLIEAVQAPLGSFACLGNHEYFRGVSRVKRIFERSATRLLVNESSRLLVDGTPLLIAGLDDPRHLGAVCESFYTRGLHAAMTDRTPEEATVLLSHRPTAFPFSADYGIRLTLAGHTHGAQLGILGRSLFNPVLPDHYLWGHYLRGESHLYTSSGVGHWFPFRLGCPPEAPVIELQRT